jgi:hypothetical protein
MTLHVKWKLPLPGREVAVLMAPAVAWPAVVMVGVVMVGVVTAGVVPLVLVRAVALPASVPVWLQPERVVRRACRCR